MSLEDRFKQFAKEQQAPAGRYQGAYERNVESLRTADAMVSKVLEAFCQAVGWGLKRTDCCDSTKGAVACNYILEHRDLWREGFVAVDVDVTWGSQSDPLDAVTVYAGEVGRASEHTRVFPSRVVIPFSGLTEDRLAAALEQQSGNVIRRISYRQRPQ